MIRLSHTDLCSLSMEPRWWDNAKKSLIILEPKLSTFQLNICFLYLFRVFFWAPSHFYPIDIVQSSDLRALFASLVVHNGGAHMILRVARPWQHPKSGIWYLRERIPSDVFEKARGTTIRFPPESGGSVATVRDRTEVIKASLRTKENKLAR